MKPEDYISIIGLSFLVLSLIVIPICTNASLRRERYESVLYQRRMQLRIREMNRLLP